VHWRVSTAPSAALSASWLPPSPDTARGRERRRPAQPAPAGRPAPDRRYPARRPPSGCPAGRITKDGSQEPFTSAYCSEPAFDVSEWGLGPRVPPPAISASPHRRPLWGPGAGLPSAARRSGFAAPQGPRRQRLVGPRFSGPSSGTTRADDAARSGGRLLSRTLGDGAEKQGRGSYNECFCGTCFCRRVPLWSRLAGIEFRMKSSSLKSLAWHASMPARKGRPLDFPEIPDDADPRSSGPACADTRRLHISAAGPWAVAAPAVIGDYPAINRCRVGIWGLPARAHGLPEGPAPEAACADLLPVVSARLRRAAGGRCPTPRMYQSMARFTGGVVPVVVHKTGTQIDGV
jgi:hypothetical protein